MNYVKDLSHDEFRDGFPVTSHRKRVWNAYINILMEFSRICDKYNLRWFAAYGTLLGAARHKGFIPWDADVDVVMFRPDYNRFMQIAKTEIHYPFYLDIWYENEELAEDPYETWPLIPFIKLRDLRTTNIEWEDRPQIHQHIAVDVLPLDSFPPFEDESSELRFRTIYELYFVTCHTKFIREELASPTGEFMLGRERIQRIYDLPLKTRGILLEEKAAQFYFDSKYISTLIYLSMREPIIYEREWFDEVTYLPFEEISIPVPIGWEKMLEADYGDWRKIKCYGMPPQDISVDIPYEKFLESKKLPDNLLTRSNSLRSRLNFDEFRAGIFINSSQKKVWRVELEILAELKRVCKKFGLKFWASSMTLFAAWKFHGFNPEDDILTFEMTPEDFQRLEFDFPFRLIGNFLMDDRTTAIYRYRRKDIPQGIFIEIKTTDQVPNEIDYIPFEFTSIPVQKNYLEVLRETYGDLENVNIQRNFRDLSSADISHEEFFSKLTRAISTREKIFLDLELEED